MSKDESLTENKWTILELFILEGWTILEASGLPLRVHHAFCFSTWSHFVHTTFDIWAPILLRRVSIGWLFLQVIILNCTTYNLKHYSIVIQISQDDV